MCGIAGRIGAGIVAPEGLGRVLDALAARGPDGERTWIGPSRRAILGHRRLAILDTTVRGEEPSVSSDRLSGFVHNGEIYNFRQLRQDLETRGERFVSESDGEVVHRLLRRMGHAALGLLEGMFALALWEDEPGRLLLARDGLGIKPLYYARLPKGLAFASQPGALLEMPELTARLDPEALSDFLSYGYVPFDRCLFAGIRKLPAAHRLVYEPSTGRLEVAPFWRLERGSVRDDPEELRDRLDRAVRSHLVSDVPVGAFLSGGLDSTVVVSRAAKAQELPTFTVAYRDGDLDDVSYARLAAAAARCAHREELLDLGDLASTLDRASAVFDEPLYDARALAMLELSRLARSEVKVALSGDGGDEVFGGYGWHETALAYERLRSSLGFLQPLFGAARQAVRVAARTGWGRRASGAQRLLGPNFVDRYFPIRGFFGAAEQREILGRQPQDAAWLFRQFDRPDLPLAHRLLSLDLHTYLPDNGLALVDRSSMAVGLEARVPLLDRQLVEYAFSLAPDRLVRPGATKVAFREAVAGWIPDSVLRRPKKGFSPPFKKWVGGTGRETALDTLRDGDLAADGVLRYPAVRRLIHSTTQRRSNKLWLLLSLEAWYHRWIRNRRPASEPAVAGALVAD
ncbi:MAG TPA: asparagine synthase (glutamine-hydrolyzing) [Thermoanaerobaculia bacterium]|nr:asparagine synthase (glutamine-hydrolyzing) [Thermoanaerobaculia bacterium]